MSHRGLVGGDPKPGLGIQGVVEQMLDRAATAACMAVKLAIDDASLSPSPCVDFRNVGRPVQSGCYPYTKIFIGIDSLQTAVVDEKGRVRYDGCFFLDMVIYLHLVALNFRLLPSVQAQRLLTSPCRS